MKVRPSQQYGFTLVELLIATLLLLILIGPLLSFMRAGQINRSATLRLSDVEQNARAAMLTISRDIENAGYNFAPTIDLGNSKIVNTLTGNSLGANNVLTPIIPGNNINQVRTVNSAGATVLNTTDQITLIGVDQAFNNGLPLPGQIDSTGSKFTSDVVFANLFPGDFVLLACNGRFAIGNVTSTAAKVITMGASDSFGLNQPNTGPLSTLNPTNSSANPPTILYKFFFITYYVDGNGNLIRREQLPPPHTDKGGNNSTAAATINPDSNLYTCAGTCYVDNIIATGVEDLQFSYYLADPSATKVTGPIDDPGALGVTANKGKSNLYRLLDIRQVNVSIKVRASVRDTKVRDPYNKNQGYLYRFSLEGTFNTRNFYGSDFRPT